MSGTAIRIIIALTIDMANYLKKEKREIDMPQNQTIKVIKSHVTPRTDPIIP